MVVMVSHGNRFGESPAADSTGTVMMEQQEYRATDMTATSTMRDVDGPICD